MFSLSKIGNFLCLKYRKFVRNFIKATRQRPYFQSNVKLPRDQCNVNTYPNVFLLIYIGDFQYTLNDSIMNKYVHNKCKIYLSTTNL